VFASPDDLTLGFLNYLDESLIWLKNNLPAALIVLHGEFSVNFSLVFIKFYKLNTYRYWSKMLKSEHAAEFLKLLM
jgi:hypothetical protein